MAVLVGAVRDHNERPSVIASAPHIAEGPRYCTVEAGSILSDAGFGDHLEDRPRGAGEVDDFVHPAMKLQVEDFISRTNGTRQLSKCFFGVIEFSGRIH